MTADEQEALWRQLRTVADTLTETVAEVRAELDATIRETRAELHSAIEKHDARLDDLEKMARKSGRWGGAQLIAIVWALAVLARLMGVDVPMPPMPGGP